MRDKGREEKNIGNNLLIVLRVYLVCDIIDTVLYFDVRLKTKDLNKK